MAKIYIRGQQNPVEVNQSEANEIKDAVNRSKNNEMLLIGGLMVRTNEVKMVKDDVIIS